MIQRIQTLFLLALIGLQLVFVCTPLAHFVLTNSDAIDFYSNGFLKMQDGVRVVLSSTLVLNLICWIIVLIAFITIFLFKTRVLQMRVCIIGMLLNLSLIATLLIDYLKYTSSNNIQTSTLVISIVIPLVNLILFVLAYRNIKKDEQLVKGFDRLR
jgi:hypothetical protein